MPPSLAELQNRIEQLYAQQMTLEAELALWRGSQPLLSTWRRPIWPLRVLARLVPRFGLWLYARLLPRSGLFDEAWYLRRYRDVQGQAARHYLRHGGFERRDPGPWFSSGHYLDLYPDILKARRNPLLHYLEAGHAEGRSIRPGMRERRPEPLPPAPTAPTAPTTPPPTAPL